MSPYILFVHADHAKKLLPLFSYTLQGYIIVRYDCFYNYIVSNYNKIYSNNNSCYFKIIKNIILMIQWNLKFFKIIIQSCRKV